MQSFDTAAIQQKIGYKFKNKQYLVQAFVHSSFANTENIPDNERMEFLGDAILDYLVGEYLFHKYPNFSSGELSKLRALVVSAEGLRPIVDGLDIMDSLMVASGCQIRTISKKLEADLYEAVLCAIYFDGGVEAARSFVMRTLQNSMDNAVKLFAKDSKTLVQEYCQKHHWEVRYAEESRTGPDNKPTFVYSLWINGEKVSEGVGSSIKQAEQNAATKIVEQWRID